MTTLFSATGSGAIAQTPNAAQPVPVAAPQESTPDLPVVAVSTPIVQPLPAAADEAAADDDDAPRAASLAALVDQNDNSTDLSRELECLAGAVYFESKSEPLAGQLAVGRVIVARSKSGRFPNSYCGVVYQRSQFSFVRGGGMPPINRASRQWKNAVAIARIANEGSWKSPAEGALYFHAARVSPGWHLTRVAQIQNHVFYR
ncbi:cell wall hydrolase [Parablastomonas sp. CN1-191]|uniref:cell wall hydrolase n=1 Tax=Parablastomonas sp. CN1-191 TaxID=3400908 RepID=UPI003BF92181